MKKGMKEMMEELNSSSKPKKMDEKSIQAKMDMLLELLGVSEEMLKGKSKMGLDEAKAMKVSVMAKDKEGLKQGLEKAEDVLEDMTEMEESEEMMEEESYADKMNPLKDEEEETEEEE